MKIDWALFFQKAPSIAVIVTLLFAVITYWIDFVNKLNFKKQLKGQLTTELRTIYFVCKENIVDYEGFVNSKYPISYKYPKLHIASPLCIYIISSGYLLKIIKSKLVRSNLISIVELTKLINDDINIYSSKTQYGVIKKAHIKYLFKSGYTVLRDRILEISEQGDFFSMDIVSKEQYKTYKLLMRWYKKNKVINKKKRGLLSQKLNFNKRFPSLMRWYKNIIIRIKKERKLLDQEINFRKSLRDPYEKEKASIEIINKYLSPPGHFCRKPPDYKKVGEIYTKIKEKLRINQLNRI